MWTPSTGLLDSTQLSPIAKPESTTTYHLYISGINGCSDNDSITISVFTKLYMPNAFAPNGNIEVNRKFSIPTTVIINLIDFSIYNRLGNKVFLLQINNYCYPKPYQQVFYFSVEIV
ncbi:MAG: hypothetical protein WDM71_00585 [Ferruginibacter sp.]